MSGMMALVTESPLVTPMALSNTTFLALPCKDYIRNVSLMLDSYNPKGPTFNHTGGEAYHDIVTNVIEKIVVPIVCIFGILGNVLNLVVLTRKQLKSSMDDMEKSSHLGLVALAVADLLFCVLYILVPLTSQHKAVYTHYDSIVLLYYNIYHEPLTNIVLLSSTWLTVIMALGRYIGICHPLHARGFINLPGTRASILGVYLGAVLANLPKFWHYYLVVKSCDELNNDTHIEALDPTHCQCYYYTKATGSLYDNTTFVLVYVLIYFIISLIVPLLVLTFCNICLIRALRQSYKMQRMYRANTPRDSGHRITPTLITIIILFTILVTPSEILAFFKRYVATHRRDYISFKTANTVANCALVTNFSINFVLYCVINVQFRKTVRDILSCACRRGNKNASPEYTKANHFTTTTVNMSDCETEM